MTATSITYLDAIRAHLDASGMTPACGPFWTVDHLADEVHDLVHLMHTAADRPDGWRLGLGTLPAGLIVYGPERRPDAAWIRGIAARIHREQVE